jgi:LmbE family N-acetylglucosaminyl deacetylase
MKNTNILFVVCHPDDEALWAGGLIHGLSAFPNVDVNVICLSGQDEHSARPAEFAAAQAIAGYKKGVILGGALRPANQSLPPTGQAVSAGLEQLGLTVSDIGVLITHSPFGEEHMHPHHVQACLELHAWTAAQKIPFGYFSCLPLPTCRLQPSLKNMKRLGALQVLNYAHCKYSLLRRAIRWYEDRPYRYPHLYIQWLVDAPAKRAMLNCYRSIDLPLHEQVYAMFNNNVESLYLFDRRAAKVFDDLLKLMEVPGSPDYFPGSWTDSGFMNNLTNKFFPWNN